jgi:hypothetical protein
LEMIVNSYLKGEAKAAQKRHGTVSPPELARHGRPFQRHTPQPTESTTNHYDPAVIQEWKQYTKRNVIAARLSILVTQHTFHRIQNPYHLLPPLSHSLSTLLLCLFSTAPRPLTVQPMSHGMNKRPGSSKFTWMPAYWIRNESWRYWKKSTITDRLDRTPVQCAT